MILSEDRQSHLAHVIVDGIWKDDIVDFTDDDIALRTAKKAVVQYVKDAGDLDQKVRNKISTLKKTIDGGQPRVGCHVSQVLRRGA